MTDDVTCLSLILIWCFGVLSVIVKTEKISWKFLAVSYFVLSYIIVNFYGSITNFLLSVSQTLPGLPNLNSIILPREENLFIFTTIIRLLSFYFTKYILFMYKINEETKLAIFLKCKIKICIWQDSWRFKMQLVCGLNIYF